MSEKTELLKSVKAALALDGTPDALKEYYATWAKNYDNDVGEIHVAVYPMVDLLVKWMEEQIPEFSPADYSVADVGCGTGLVARLLAKKGFEQIDGMDLSEEMIDQAAKHNVYRNLFADVDINLDTHTQWHGQYDIVACCGVFTLGHVQPESLLNMARFAKPGGLLVTSTRKAYYDSTHIQQISDQFEASGAATLLRCVKDAPYTNDSTGHFWLYQIAD